jgi:hypothetical protein
LFELVDVADDQVAPSEVISAVYLCLFYWQGFTLWFA